MAGTTSLTPNTATDISAPKLTGLWPGMSVGSTGTWARSPCVSIMSAPPWLLFTTSTQTPFYRHSPSTSIRRLTESTGLEAFMLMII